jgi:hypothetical protein
LGRLRHFVRILTMLIYIVKDNDKYDGPFTIQQIKKMLREQTIGLNQSVLIEGQTERVYLRQIKEVHDGVESGQFFSSESMQPIPPLSLRVIKRSELPQEQILKLFSEEIVYHFGYIDVKGGGCANTSAAKQWILVTNQRILFEAAVRGSAGNQITFRHQSGSIPMSKVSYVGTSTAQTTEGCSQTRANHLRINSSGGEIILAIPTPEEASRIQGVIDAIISKN